MAARPLVRRRVERGLVVLAVLLLVVLPSLLHGWPTTLRGNLFVLLVLVGGLALVWWRDQPRVAAVGSLGLFLPTAAIDGWLPDSAVVLFAASFGVLALAWSGRNARIAAGCGVAYLAVFYLLTGAYDWVALLMFTVPPYLAGTIYRTHREVADQLAVRASELEEERELFAEIAVRHERARIAGELHDVIGHAISVMVIQAAAGQRLIEADPTRARAAFTAIAESSRQGTRDLERLLELLGGDAGETAGPDLSLIDEIVSRAARSGLNVTCRFEGAQDRVPPTVAHLAFRVVQESLTNAIRYAPGADVRVVLRADDTGRGLDVRVENGHASEPGPSLTSTGRGLIGLRERIQTIGGHLVAGATGHGGWAVEARLPGL